MSCNETKDPSCYMSRLQLELRCLAKMKGKVYKNKLSSKYNHHNGYVHTSCADVVILVLCLFPLSCLHNY